ncbi:MAG: tRNA lysidine(34) synthetase TilS [Nibricoccus sp.]
MPADWKNFPALFPRSALHPAVVSAADTRPADESWCVAFSGGADSLALLLLIWTHWPERRSRLTALHFNHGLRGAASDGDEQFCREVCADLEIGFSSAKWPNPPEHPGEAEARAARQEFFAREMSAREARVLWTGHQKDDIAETQLMRLARGAGPAGLAAPRPLSAKEDDRIFLRPLLTLSKGEILAALTAAGVAWREDATNSTRDYFRTRVRYEVLPHWQDAACASVLGGAALSRELCEEDDVALEFWLRQLGVEAAGNRLDLQPLRGLPRALWRRALRRWRPLATLSRAGFDELLTLCETGAAGRVSVADGFVGLSDFILRWEPATGAFEPWAAVELGEGSAVKLPDGAEIMVRRIVFDAELRKRILAGQVDCRREAFVSGAALPLVARPWRAGDRFHPLGAPGSAKIQDWFVNRKIPVERRGILPIICSTQGSVLWVPGFPPAETAKVTTLTVEGVQLTYREGTSTLTTQS